MSRPYVHCRICKKEIDRDRQDDWMMTSTNYFYHIKCYEDWAKKKTNLHTEADDEMWQAALWDYLWKDLRIGDLNFAKMQKQWVSYLGQGMTPKGIFFCMKYFYEVQHGSPDKCKGGIGIVPYIYKEGCEYWCQRELHDKGICERIEQQIRAMELQSVKQIQRSYRAKKKIKTYGFDFVDKKDEEE